MPKASNKKDKGSDHPLAVRKPHDWEKATSAAFLRILGATQQEAADSVGVARQTVVKWEHSEWWPEAMDDAKQRWLAGLHAKARVSVENGLQDDARLAFMVLERLEPTLHPKAALEVSGGEKPVAIEITRRVVDR